MSKTWIIPVVGISLFFLLMTLYAMPCDPDTWLHENLHCVAAFSTGTPCVVHCGDNQCDGLKGCAKLGTTSYFWFISIFPYAIYIIILFILWLHPALSFASGELWVMSTIWAWSFKVQEDFSWLFYYSLAQPYLTTLGVFFGIATGLIAIFMFIWGIWRSYKFYKKK